jgi:hypothetical protein
LERCIIENSRRLRVQSVESRVHLYGIPSSSSQHTRSYYRYDLSVNMKSSTSNISNDQVQAAIDARLDVVEGSISRALMTVYLKELIITELIQTEDKYTDIRDALKPLNKMDFDKLIASVSFFLFPNVALISDGGTARRFRSSRH